MRAASFPVSPVNGSLCLTDFSLLASRFKRVFFALVPTATDTRFLLIPADLPSTEKQQEQPWLTVARHAAQTGLPKKESPDSLYFPMCGAEREVLVAEVSGVDPLVLEKATDEWLADTGQALSDELKKIKGEFLDPITGLYGCNLFFEAVTEAIDRQDLHLVLIEALPPSRSIRDRFSPVLNTGSLLKNYNRRSFPLFHLGMAVFAILVSDQQRINLSSFCLSLITALKGHGCRRVRCGCTSVSLQRGDGRLLHDHPRLLLDEAWQALQVACRRGPFAFCDYDTLINPEHAPLRPISRSLIAKVRRRCRQLDVFSLVLFTFDFQKKVGADVLLDAGCETRHMLPFADGYLVIVGDARTDEVRAWAVGMIERICSNKGADYSLSAGISAYPEHGSRIAEIINNTRKALLHAAFFGPRSVVVFDAVSLNVSGDVFFAEGDWNAAVREYRRGLDRAPADINLLNSLGVTYALMNRTGDAVRSFTRVIDLEPDNFMALYNQGLGRQAVGQYRQAAASFSRAREVYNPEDTDQAGAIDDLLYQLGICFFHLGNYVSCMDMLTAWHARQGAVKSAGACCRYLGISAYHRQHFPDASRWLQLALAHDKFDAESLSLLGDSYRILGEGDDIALRLTEKAVEIAGPEPVFLLRWGRALAACGKYDQAIEQFRRCAAVRKTRIDAWLEIGTVYGLQGRYRQARRYIKKLITGRDVPDEIRSRAQTLCQHHESLR
ncbi:tetratricopeptide repeat protein [Desulfofustis glycolicus]|uniref:Tetratricopeptide (TPR) repeat n=1 Tax=Desulfofustis glycolicus DSM 9705 TaxID=1121409 RepID=A0A1M5Y3L6_9BACT|nr:hypothetical protein [Desulfofustis glycolicus]SHI06592.1 Tetratricopeptide (TPR) repeat [Desulfofustis glycolicus DSM 9705]